MVNTLKQRKQEGFTIIEVMIVLAIAAMILLVVLLAVPALQRSGRNTAIKDDAAAISSGVTEYESNNSAAPVKYIGGPTNGLLTLCDASPCTTTPANPKVQGSDTVNLATNTSSNTVTAGTIYVIPGASCSTVTWAANKYTATAGSSRATAVVYVIETSSALSGQCIDS